MNVITKIVPVTCLWVFGRGLAEYMPNIEIGEQKNNLLKILRLNKI
jgi:hypothetical protein